MSNQRFYSSHLYNEPERLERFRIARSKVERGKGSNTIALEDIQPFDSLGEINFGPPLYSKIKVDSNYLILISLQSYPLKYGNNRIGRFDDNDIVIDDICVSRRHCCIVIHSDGRVELFDTASKNHTFVNGIMIDRCWLKSGDEIRLANTCPLLISLVEEQKTD